MRKIPLAKPFFAKEEITKVQKVLDSGWVAQGPSVKEFENILSRYLGVSNAIAVNSCTSALHLALLSHGISKGDKVIVPDFTFTATGNVVLHVGAEPELVDIDPTTLCIDIESIKEKIEDRVKAIIPVHSFGYPAKIKEINQIAAQNGIIVIEDAALALGSELEMQKIGSHGNTACFSLQGRKVITTGEGGIVTTEDKLIADKLRALRSQGAITSTINQKGVQLPIFQMMGFNYRLSDIQAAIGIVQMNRIEEFITRRIYLAGYYNDLFEDSRLDVKIPRSAKGVRHNYQTYIIVLDKGNRNEVILRLREKGIESTIGTYSLSAQPLFYRKEEFPNSKYAYEHSLALPMYHELSEENIDYIVGSIKSILH